jgi:hypothetical protein
MKTKVTLFFLFSAKEEELTSSQYPGYVVDKLGEDWRVAWLPKEKFQKIQKEIKGVEGYITTSPGFRDKATASSNHRYPVENYEVFLHSPSAKMFLATYFGWGKIDRTLTETIDEENDWIDLNRVCWHSGDKDVVLNIVFDDVVCACGSPGAVVKIVREVLNSFRGSLFLTEEECDEKRKLFFYNDTDERLEGFGYLAAYLLDAKGFLEHGTSIGQSWPTFKGYMLQLFLNLYFK